MCQNKSVKETKKMCDFFLFTYHYTHKYCTIPKKRPITNKKELSMSWEITKMLKVYLFMLISKAKIINI